MKQNMFIVKKSFGQNFLSSKRTIQKVIQASCLEEKDTVLEVGPGFGALTFPLAQKVKKVIAIEKDKALVSFLKESLPKNVSLIQGDILKDKPFLKKYKVVANLPYNIAAKVVMDFLTSNNPPELMVVMVQKEVGQRMCSKLPRMEKLGVFCQVFSKPKIVSFVKKECFSPKPKVDSAIVKFENISLPKINEELFSKVVSSGFSFPRKTLLNNLSKGFNLPKERTSSWIEKCKLSPLQRPETLAVDNWLCLTDCC